MIKVKTDIKGWKSVVHGLQKISGKDFAEIIEAETSEIVAQSSNRKATKMADKTKLVRNMMPHGENFIGYTGNKLGYTVKAGEAGLTKDTTFYLKNRLPNKIWFYIVRKQFKKTKEHFGNIGLNKGQFYLFHDVLKLPEPKKDFQRQAKNFYRLRRNRISDKAFATKIGEGKKFEIRFQSNLGLAISFGKSASSLKSVMRARAKKYFKAIEKGTLDSIKKRTRAYPLIFGGGA